MRKLSDPTGEIALTAGVNGGIGMVEGLALHLPRRFQND